MASDRLPLILQRVTFEQVDQDSPLSDRRDGTPNEESRSSFEARVEQLAQEYLRGRPLFLLSASLRGPFQQQWDNPWAAGRLKINPTSHYTDREHIRRGKRQGGEKAAKLLRHGVAKGRITTSVLQAKVQSVDNFSKDRLLDEHESGEASERRNDPNGGLVKPSKACNSRHRPAMQPISFTPINRDNVQKLLKDNEEDGNKASSTHGDVDPHGAISDVQDISTLPSERRNKKDTIVERATRDIMKPPTSVSSCCECGTESTCGWKRGPNGPGTLCNACGTRFWRKNRKAKLEIAKAASASTVPVSGTAVSGPESFPTGTDVNEPKMVPHRPMPEPAIGRAPEEEPHGPHSLSQPEFRSSHSTPRKGFFEVSSSLPTHTTSLRLHHGEIMESMFPKGLLADAFDRHGQLVDLMRGDATARLREVLRLPQGSRQKSAIPIKVSAQNRTVRKKRVMTFDNPVTTKKKKKVQVRADQTCQTQSEQSAKHVTGGSGVDVLQCKHVGQENVTNKEILAGTEKLENTASKTRSLEAFHEPPFLSTQMAMLQAHIAFQQGLDSPLKQNTGEAEVSRTALKDKTDKNVGNTPIRKFKDMRSESSSSAAQTQKHSFVNTQSLFDAFPTFGSSPAPAETGGKDKKTKKRASFAESSRFEQKDDETSGYENISFQRHNVSDILRKSTLKRRSASTLPQSSSVQSTKQRDQSLMNAMPSSTPGPREERVSNYESEEKNDPAVESFLQDANSLLRSWGADS